MSFTHSRRKSLQNNRTALKFSGGIANIHAPGRQRFNNNRTGTNNTSFADRDTWMNEAAGRYPSLVINTNRLCNKRKSRKRIVMTSGTDHCLLRDDDVMTNNHRGNIVDPRLIRNTGSAIDDKMGRPPNTSFWIDSCWPRYLSPKSTQDPSSPKVKRPWRRTKQKRIGEVPSQSEQATLQAKTITGSTGNSF